MHLTLSYGITSKVSVLAAAALTILSISATSPARAQEPFTYLWINSSVTATGFGAVSWTDIDRDGDQDLLTLGRQGFGPGLPKISLWSNLETRIIIVDGGRWPSTIYEEVGLTNAPALWLGQIDWADYDNDGDLDAVVTGTPDRVPPYGPLVRIVRNDGVGGMTIVDPALQPFLGDADWADFDNDGDSDLLITGEDDAGFPHTRLYKNEGGAFVAVDSGLPPVRLGSAAWTDVDNDGDLDVALCGAGATGDALLAVYRNDGNTLFSALSIPGDGYFYCRVEWGDYNADGFDDLLVSGSRLSHAELQGHTRIYQSDRGTRFVDANVDVVGAAAGTAQWIDMDLDGVLDILVLGARDVAFRRLLGRIYLGTDEGYRFASNIRGVQPSNAFFGDFDGDGDPDLAVIGTRVDGSVETTLYLNAELDVNEAPTVPDGLSSVVSAGDVQLSWNPSSDPTTASPSLTYNLRVGTAAGMGDVMSSPVGPAGIPLHSARGNVGHSASWRLSGLANGTYFWSVQAVDNSLHASPFSEAATFTVTASSGSKPVATEELMPTSFHLHDPYPNPVTEVTSLEYELPSAGRVTLGVYDVLGKRVSLLLDDFQAAGRHVFRWWVSKAEAPAAGLYVLRMSHGAQVRTSRVVIVR